MANEIDRENDMANPKLWKVGEIDDRGWYVRAAIVAAKNKAEACEIAAARYGFASTRTCAGCLRKPRPEGLVHINRSGSFR